MFAAQHGLTLKVIPTNNPVQRLAQAPDGAMIGAGGIYRPSERMPAAEGNVLVYSSAYYAIEPVLIYNIDGFRPGTWKDLAGETVGMLEGSGLESALVKVRERASGSALAIAGAAVDRSADQPGVGWDAELRHRCVERSQCDAQRLPRIRYRIHGRRQAGIGLGIPKAQTRLREQVDSFSPAAGATARWQN